jgi:O-methyltransferase
MDEAPALAVDPVATEARYLELLRKVLTRTVPPDHYLPVEPRRGTWRAWAHEPVRRFLDRRGFALVRRFPFDPERRAEGRDWPPEAETMIGLRRLEHLGRCVAEVLEDEVPGDLLEAGTWRGGAAIYMKAVLTVHGDTSRTVWLADSFAGHPAPDPECYPIDAGDRYWAQRHFRTTGREEVEASFARYGLLDERVRFLVGWFRHTLPAAPVERLALLRIDADMYESTLEALEALYPRLSPGGWVVVDDYGCLPRCRAAVDDFRAAAGIIEPLRWIDWTAVGWRRRPRP